MKLEHACTRYLCLSIFHFSSPGMLPCRTNTIQDLDKWNAKKNFERWRDRTTPRDLRSYIKDSKFSTNYCKEQNATVSGVYISPESRTNIRSKRGDFSLMRALIILDIIITVTPVSRSSLVDPVWIFTFIYFFTVHVVTLSRTAFDFYTSSTSTQTSIYRKSHQESVFFRRDPYCLQLSCDPRS